MTTPITRDSGGSGFVVELEKFSGPLDLLLHLIREDEVDITDLPIAKIADQFLSVIQDLGLNQAADYLEMAARLLRIKAQMLLPRRLGDDEWEDPRAELVRRLLEYQKYREAAEQLQGNDLLDRDVFARRVRVDRVPFDPEEIGLQEISVFKLIEALDRVLKAASPDVQHEVVRDRVSLSDAIHRIAERLRAEGQVGFFSLFEGQRQRQQIVITFLALLEMAKLRLVRIFQEEGEEIVIRARGEALADVNPTEVDEREYR